MTRPPRPAPDASALLGAVRARLANVADPAALLAGLFALAPVAFQVYAADGHCVLVNQAFRDLFGSEPPPGYNVLRDELAARDGYLGLIHRAFAGETIRLPPTWYDPRELRQVEVPEGRRVYIEGTFFPLSDAAGRVTHVAITFKDLTAEQLARELLEREHAAAERERARAEAASRAKDEFLATLSHELRTPITAVLGWVRLLRAGGLPPEKHQRALETIDRNTRAQVQLIEDLLDFTRITTGRLRLDVAPVEPAAIVEAALETLRPAADARGVRLEASLEPGAGPLLGDATRLGQIAWNLLSNAVKFTPRGGRVVVRLRRVDASVEIAVADDGQGIEPAFLPRIFDRFTQQDASPTRAHGGLGLGLAIVKHLVELHGGTIGAESEGPGRGATFTVRVPVAPPRAAPPPPGPAAGPRAGVPLAPPPEIAGLRVLVVDDELDARELLRAVLSQCDVAVATAASASEAFDQLRTRPPDLLVSDIGMPGEDGYSLIRRVRALPDEAGGQTPAVALTAYARPEDRTRALVEGFNSYVPKPVEPQELVAVLASLTKLSKPAR